MHVRLSKQRWELFPCRGPGGALSGALQAILSALPRHVKLNERRRRATSANGDLAPALAVPLPRIAEHPSGIIAAEEDDAPTHRIVRSARRATSRRHRLDALPPPVAP